MNIDDVNLLFSLKVFGCKEEKAISQMIQDKPDGTIMPQRLVHKGCFF